jgi:hypothetical protein
MLYEMGGGDAFWAVASELLELFDSNLTDIWHGHIIRADSPFISVQGSEV